MKKFLFFAACAILCACEPQFVDPGSSLRDLPTPGFTWEIDGLTVMFTNTSTPDLTLDYWEFGDGHNSTTDNPSHTYTQAGTYHVVLHTKTNTWSKYTCAATIDVKGGSSQGGGGGDNPTQPYEYAYVKGFKLYNVYNAMGNSEKVYYKFDFIGHDLWGNADPQIKTAWSSQMYSNNELPKIFALPSRVKIAGYPDPFGWYNYFQVRVYYAKSKSAEGVTPLDETIGKGVLNDSMKEYIVTSSNGTKVGILFDYE